MPRFAVPLLLLAVSAVAVRPLVAQIPPDARWLAFETEHFRVSFTAGLEPTARRAADRAEAAYAALSEAVLDPPRGPIELVVADNVDFPNGYATPIPTNRIVVYAHPPASEPSLAFYEDWLYLVILHELVHIFHLDLAEGIPEALRRVFGRNPLLFPEVLAPGWFVEGLATFYESELTRGGRVRGTQHEMVLRTAILEGEFFPIDRATAEPIRWPAGGTRYMYGSLFLAHLTRTYGEDRVTDFIRRMGRQIVPYRLNAAARAAFGVSFQEAWRAWEESLRARYTAEAASLRAAGLTEPELLTTHGRGAYYPRFSPDGSTIAYSAATGLDEPALRLLRPDGSSTDLVDRTSLSPAAWYPDGSGLLTSQHDYVDPYRIYSDLHTVSMQGGRARLTRGERVWEPDLHPDGRRAVFVASAEGTNTLSIRDLRTGATRPLTEASQGVHWSLPRWSPDGSSIAAARWEHGGLYDIVVLDTAGTVLRRPTRDRAVDAAPAWSPGGRYVLFSSDRTGIPNLFAYDLEADRLLQVTNLLTGAAHPDVSPDGRWIVFAVYGPGGYDIARIPYDPDAWRPAGALRAEVAEPIEPPVFPEAARGPVRPYSPLPSVLPAAWSLLLEGGTDLGIGIGGAAFGQDVVGRHVWNLEAVGYPDDLRFAGAAAYRYRGLANPVLASAASQRWRVWRERGGVVVDGDTLDTGVLRRDRTLEAAASWLRRRWRSSAWLELGGEVNELDFVWDVPEAARGLKPRQLPLDLGARLEAGYTNARGYGVSIGPQEGITLAAALSGHRYAGPLEGETDARGYLRLRGRGRGFRPLALPGFARHVVALRLETGAETGSLSPGFSLGGASGGAPPVPLQIGFLGGGFSFPVRGYPAGTQAGHRAVSASAEYRFPLALVERGIGLLPLSLGRVWGDLFADAGAAWCGGDQDRCVHRISRAPTEIDPIYSAGAELVLHLRLGYLAEVPLRIGGAIPLTGGEYGAKPTAYVRIGRSF